MAWGEERWAAALPSRRGDRLRALAPAVLLVAIGALGVYRSVTLDQSSWQGASFGMFATYDNRASRTLEVTIERADGTERIVLPAHLQDNGTRLVVVPTDDGARRLAEAVLAATPDAVRAEVVVRRVRIDGDEPLRLHLEPIATGMAE
jgi:hypothetical protein